MTYEYDINTANGREYRLLVALPFGYERAESDTVRYPVLYILDGEDALPAAAATLRNRNDAGPGGVILVGVGYRPGSELGVPPPGSGDVPFRMRDYSPPPYPASNPEHSTWQSEQPWAGGAPAFLRALSNEIIPFIESRFRTNGDRGLRGHSIGGLFATYVLLEEPTLFTRYAITSPSLWWDGGSIFEREQRTVELRDGLRARVHVSVGGLEGAGMIADMWRLVATLCHGLERGMYSGLELTAEVIEGVPHSSPVSLWRAADALYPTEENLRPSAPCEGR